MINIVTFQNIYLEPFNEYFRMTHAQHYISNYAPNLQVCSDLTDCMVKLEEKCIVTFFK